MTPLVFCPTNTTFVWKFCKVRKSFRSFFFLPHIYHPDFLRTSNFWVHILFFGTLLVVKNSRKMMQTMADGSTSSLTRVYSRVSFKSKVSKVAEYWGAETPFASLSKPTTVDPAEQPLIVWFIWWICVESV